MRLIALLTLAVLGASSSASAQSFFRADRNRFSTEEAMLRPQRRSVEAPESAPKVLRGADGPTVSGSRAVLRRGVAYAPSSAPRAVKELIWAANRISRMPYKWGGGHGSFRDSGYDCSGTISYALHHAGLLRSPQTSSSFTGWGKRGRGRWVTVYARKGHVFAVVAGLRLDAMGSAMGRSGGPRWYGDMRSTRSFAARTADGL